MTSKGTDLELSQGHLEEVEDGVWQCRELGDIRVVAGHITEQEKETCGHTKDTAGNLNGDNNNTNKFIFLFLFLKSKTTMPLTGYVWAIRIITFSLSIDPPLSPKNKNKNKTTFLK